MPDWDRDSSQLDRNLVRALSHACSDARRGQTPVCRDALAWHREIMLDLHIPPEDYEGGYSPEALVGRFRGRPGLEGYNVGIGRFVGVRADLVEGELIAFEAELHRRLALLDDKIPKGATEADLTARQIIAVIRLCSWAHAEWIRIHPLANGNGRTARIWANCLAVRYGLPPFVRLRPRPGPAYEAAGAAAMEEYWEATFLVFLDFYETYQV